MMLPFSCYVLIYIAAWETEVYCLINVTLKICLFLFIVVIVNYAEKYFIVFLPFVKLLLAIFEHNIVCRLLKLLNHFNVFGTLRDLVPFAQFKNVKNTH